MKKISLKNKWCQTALAILCCAWMGIFTAQAYDVLADGIAYNINPDSSSLTVTYTQLPGNYDGLTSAIVPATVTIGEKNYQVTALGDYAFYGCESLTTVVLPESISKIGDRALAQCAALDSISVDENNFIFDSRGGCNAVIESNWGRLMAGCHKTTIANGVYEICAYAFAGSNRLTAIDIPYWVEKIGYEAFAGTALETVELPAYLLELGYRAFAQCPNLAQITVDERNEKYDSRDSCNAVVETSTGTLVAGCKATAIPSTVEKIGYEAFSGCAGLTELVIPDSVNTIGHYAFRDATDLQVVDIPTTANTFGDRAFGGCTGLKKVYARLRTPETGSYYALSTFQGVPVTTCLLLVDADLIETYRVTAPWKDFLMIQDMDHDYIIGDVTGDGKVDVADVNAIINIILKNKTQDDYPGIADIDGNGIVDVSDVNMVINIILKA